MSEAQHNKTTGDKSIGELFTDLTQGVSTLAGFENSAAQQLSNKGEK